MKFILLTLTALAMAAQTQEKLPPPTPPADVILIIEEDGVRDKHAMSDFDVEALNNFLHAQGFVGTFRARYLAWISKVSAELASRPEFAPAQIKALDAEIAAKQAAKKAAIDAARAEKKK